MKSNIKIVDGNPFGNMTKETVYDILKPCFDDRVLINLTIHSFEIDTKSDVVVVNMSVYHKYFKETWELSSNIRKQNISNFKGVSEEILVFNHNKVVEVMLNYGFLKIENG